MSIRELNLYFQKAIKADILYRHIAQWAEYRPIRLFLDYREHIAFALHILWLVGCGYWVYTLAVVDVKPQAYWVHLTDDPREAIVFVFFGLFGCIYIGSLVLFLLKLVYNLFQGSLLSLVPNQWYSIAQSVCYLMLLSFAFSYIENIKAAGLTTYNQIAGIIQTSKQHDIMVEQNIKTPYLMNLFEE